MGVRGREPRFKIGDHVRIVDEPYEDCPHGWVSPMTHYCGRDAIITGVYAGTYEERDSYYLDVDDGYCSWCMNCFVLEPEVDIKESDKDISFLLG